MKNLSLGLQRTHKKVERTFKFFVSRGRWKSVPSIRPQSGCNVSTKNESVSLFKNSSKDQVRCVGVMLPYISKSQKLRSGCEMFIFEVLFFNCQIFPRNLKGILNCKKALIEIQNYNDNEREEEQRNSKHVSFLYFTFSRRHIFVDLQDYENRKDLRNISFNGKQNKLASNSPILIISTSQLYVVRRSAHARRDFTIKMKTTNGYVQQI